MNIEEVSNVLARVQLGDNREVDDKGLVLGDWVDLIGDLDFTLAIEAVRMHRCESTAYLVAAHIRANVRLLQGRAEREARIQAQSERLALGRKSITLDRAQFEIDTQTAITAERVRRGVDPVTGKAFVFPE